MTKYYFYFFIFLFLFSQERVIALRVDFQEDQSEFTTGNGKFDLRIPDPDSVVNHIIDPAPHNKSYFEDHLLFAKNYLKKFLDIDITYEVYPSAENEVFHLSKKMFDYNPNTREDSLRGLLNLYTEAYSLALNAGITISTNDIVVVFHAGTGNDIFLDIDYTPHDIPSISLNEEFVKKFDISFYNSGKSIRGVILPETASQEGFELAMNGLVVANIATQIGLLDLVDPVKRQSVVGPWSVEDRGLFNANGLLPSIPSAVNRFLFNLRQDKTDTVLPSLNTKTITVDVLSDASNTEIVYIPINENEYYLIENRQRPIYKNDSRTDLEDLRIDLTPVNSSFLNYKELLKHQDFQYRDRFEWSTRGVLVNTTEFDAAIPHSGLLVWKLDKRQINRFKNKNRLNSEEHYRAVQLIEADGVDNLNTNIGGEQEEKNDLFYSGNKGKFYKNTLNSNSLPHSKSFYENALTGIELSNFSAISSSMTFDLKLEEKVHERFNGRFHDLFQENDSIFIVFSSNNLLYRKIFDSDMQLLAYDSVLTGKISGFEYQNGSNLYFIKDSVFNTNFINTNFIVKRNSNIKTIIKSYLLEESGIIAQIQSDFSFIDFSLQADTIFEINNAVIAKSSIDGEYYHIDVDKITNLTVSSEKILPRTNAFYELKYSGTNISAVNHLSSVSYDFPRKIHYSFKEQKIVDYFESEGYGFSRDELNIYKIFPIRGETKNQQSIYTGSKIEKFLLTNDLVIYASSNKLYHEKLKSSLKNLRPLSNTLSFDGIDKDKTFLWPNPNLDDNKINIRLFSSRTASLDVTVFQSDGRYVDSFKINVPANLEFDYPWNVKDLPSGTYILLLKNNDFEKILKAAVVH